MQNISAPPLLVIAQELLLISKFSISNQKPNLGIMNEYFKGTSIYLSHLVILNIIFQYTKYIT